MVLRKEISLQIKDLLKENPQGLSITDIVKVVPINRNTAGRYLENLLISGQVEMRRLGMAKIYMLSQRVPLSAVLSISSELVMQLDSSLRIIFANDPFLKLVGADNKNLLGKNIEYTPVALVFEEAFTGFIENVKEGVNGREWAGEIALSTKGIILFCRIAPTVFEDGRKGVSVILEDITGEKRAELTLQESEDRYRKLVEISPDAVFLHREGKIMYANPAAFKIVGASHSDEIIGKNILDFIHPDFRNAVRKNIEKDLRGNITPPIELHMLRVDGTSIIVEGRGVKTTLDGKPAVQVAIRDITERKHAEEALRESEEKYRTLINRANDVISIVQDGVIKMCNPRLAEFWGGSIEEVLGKPFTDFIHPDALPVVIDRYNRRMTGESPPSLYETVFIRKDGSKSYVELNAGIISYEGKTADLVIVRDINERKMADIKLRASEERLRLILDCTDDLIIMQDREGRYLYFNSAARYGVSEEEMLGLTPYDFLDGESATRIVERLKKVVKTGQSISEDTQIVWKGQTLWFSDSLSPVKDANGTITSVVTVSRNITDRKNTEDALIHNEQRFRNLITATGDIVWETDDRVQFVYVSPQAESIIGYKPEELVGHTPFEFLQADAIEPNKKTFRTAIEKRERSIIYISHWNHKDGHGVYLESHAVPIYRSDGSFSGFIGIDRKKTL